LPNEEGYPVNSAAWRFTKNNTGDSMTKEIFGAFVALLALSAAAAGAIPARYWVKPDRSLANNGD
jgi:hypothetical protein